jgi:outer membrane protein insertion porin family
MDRSIRNVRNLGYFSDVKVQTIQGTGADQSITRVTVQEQSTGDLTIGAGYSSLDKAMVTFGINERNFLGTGRRASVSLSTSASQTNFNLGITEPYLLGRNLTGRFDIFNTQSKGDDTTVKRTGFSVGLGFAAANDIYHRISYELSRSRTSAESTTARSITGENNKTLLRSAIDYSVSKDTRDSRFDPTEGYLLKLEESVAGLGGDVKYLSTKLSAGYYKPILFKSVILGATGKIGYVTGLGGEKVTQSNRFYLGGRDIRGFAGSGVGPRDTGSTSAVGGNKMFAGRLEVVSDIGFDKDSGIRWTVFNDFGSLWDTDYPSGVTGAQDSIVRASLGVGIYWMTAIGPLTFSLAKPFSKSSYDQTKTFQFNIGTRL